MLSLKESLLKPFYPSLEPIMSLLTTLLLVAPLPSVQSPDPRIAALVAQVEKTRIRADVETLSAYPTRRATSPEAWQVKDWLVGRLSSLPGAQVSTESFDPAFPPNVICEYPGVSHPERVVIVGAHYDSINQSGIHKAAPGADDNASGTSAVLEIARVLAGTPFEDTVHLVLFSTEELGLVGSEAHAKALRAQGTQVVGMINLDMIAYREANDAYDVDFLLGYADTQLSKDLAALTPLYVPTLGVTTHIDKSGDSDHASFQDAGYPAVFPFEDFEHDSPFLHTSADTIGTSANDFNLARDITRGAVAWAAFLAQPLDMEIQHTPLESSEDAGGPYPIRCQVQSLNGIEVTEVTLYHRLAKGPWRIEPMLPSAQNGEWLGSIPGPRTRGVIEYYIVAEDLQGNEEWWPEARKAGRSTQTLRVERVLPIFSDDFEGSGNGGWTSHMIAKEDDWQKGVPSGIGGFDPPLAASGTQVWGNDLGQGGMNGKYRRDMNNYLESPPIDCSTATGVELRFQRWLTVEDGAWDHARIEVNGVQVWENPASAFQGADHLIDSAWQSQLIDISSIADGSPSVRVSFHMEADSGLNFGGWTIDDVALVEVQDGVVNPLTASRAFLSVAEGGSLALSIDAGPSHAFAPVFLRLAVDQTTGGVSQVLPRVSGMLSAEGKTELTFTLPPGLLAGQAGGTLRLAAVAAGAPPWISNVVSVGLAR